MNHQTNKSILHVKNSRSKSHAHAKRGHKGKDCIYYDPDKKSCGNRSSGFYQQFCHHDFCDSKQYKTDTLSTYDDSYIELPQQASYHDTTQYRESLSNYLGTPSHIGYLQRADGEPRRHKARCKYYNKIAKSCTYYRRKCPRSAHCKMYTET